MKKFIYKKTIDHLMEASLLCMHIDIEMAKVISEITSKLTQVHSGRYDKQEKKSVDLDFVETKLKEKLHE